MFRIERFSDKAVITIYGYVGGWNMDAVRISQVLFQLQSEGFTKIDFHYNTFGGDVFEGNLICNFIEAFKGEFTLYIDGIAASMGSIFTTKAKTYIAKNGFIMIHRVSGGGYGNVNDLRSAADLMESMEANFIKDLVAKTKKTEGEIKALFDGTDHWFNATQAIAFGLVEDTFEFKPTEVAQDTEFIEMDTEECCQMGAENVYRKFAAQFNPKNVIPINTNTINEMDKQSLIDRYKLTNVTAESTDEEVMSAIDAKIAEGETQAQNLLTQSITACVNQAIEAKKITAEKKDHYIGVGQKIGIDNLTDIFKDMNSYQPISGKINNQSDGGKGGEDRSNWTFNDYQEKDPKALAEMSKNDEEKFKALYKAEFGVEL